MERVTGLSFRNCLSVEIYMATALSGQGQAKLAVTRCEPSLAEQLK
jgi:hypothetical protein